MKGVKEIAATEVKEGVELTLNLSSNGRFGVDPDTNNKVTRTSSVPNLCITPHKKSSTSDTYGADLTLWSSLSPLAIQEEGRGKKELMEEEWRKKKELQYLRRLDTKIKRSKKSGIPRAGTYENVYRAGVPQFFPQGSIRSQGSGSSTVSQLQCQTIHGSNIGSSIDENKGKVVGPVEENKSPKAVLGEEVNKERKVDLDAEKPHVFINDTNGSRIEGFLYQYNREHEVKIMCVCHGSSFTPAEFVKHAGGGDVANPLKHITIERAHLIDSL